MTLIQANALNIPLVDGCVQCVATSPPYWGLRKYEGAQTFEWPEVQYAPLAGLPPLTVPAMRCELGLEPTPEAYIGHLVAVFREVRRVLREDGTVWLNLGDSYANDTKWGGTSGDKNYTSALGNYGGQRVKRDTGMKPKDLVGIPWRAAFALQADGWWLRSDCVWEKPNALPESVEDRPNKSHEYIYLLTKNARYFYDAEAVRVAASDASLRRIQQSTFATQTGGEKDYGTAGVNSNRSMRRTLENFAKNPGRNLRTVWTVPTFASAVHHFAVWPPALVEPMVKAGTSERGCCPVCGAGWVRVVESHSASAENERDWQGVPEWQANRNHAQMPKKKGAVGTPTTSTLGWRPSCACGRDDTVPALVLDPFNGSGTTGVVARNLGRRYVGLDVGYTYLHDIARPRMSTEFGREPVATAAEVAPLETLPLFAGGDR